MNLNPKYVQLIGDALIPLLGFFWWDWSLYFILLFYGLDLIANEIIIHLKSRKIIQFQSEDKQIWLKLGVFSAFTLILIVFLCHLTILNLYPSIDFQQEIISFWQYEELGIQQGFILVPLIAITAYQQYSIFFIRTQIFRKVGLKSIWKNHLTALLIILGITGIFLGLSKWILIPDVVIIIGIVVLSSVYSLLRK